MSKKLTEVEEQLAERSDEIADLKAERNNMKVSTTLKLCI
ncbi:unnamed protein product [Trichobilharzia regenti]|nr:unnamed protein product [Trichobilharzia regenti]